MIKSVKGTDFILFILRLFFYLSAMSLILVHPGIPVSFDRIGVVQWFIIIPLQAFIAFLPARSFNFRKRCIIALLFLIPLSIWAGGFGPGALSPLLAGFICFTLTHLLFYHPRWAKPAVLEPFFLAWVCLRLLALSRSGEDIAGQSMALTQFILVWTAAVFLLHSVVIYFCLFPQSSAGAWKEGALFFFSALTVLLAVLVVLPPDFVNNSVIKNLIAEKIPERIRSSDIDKGIPNDSGGRREGRRTIPSNGNAKQPGLRGLSEYNWVNRSGRGSGTGENRQYMVMVVASEREPVYMGNSFRGHLDPVQGFLVSFDEPLNSLVNQRFFVTWFNNEPNYDIGRRRLEVFSLSTLPQKYLPYRPFAIDPTILSENSGPLRYIHQVVSNAHNGDPLSLIHEKTRPFSNFEKSILAPYLNISLEDSDREKFSAYLEQALKTWKDNRSSIIGSDPYLLNIFNGKQDGPDTEEGNEYLEKIIAVLVSFSGYQYNLSYNDDYSIDALKDFLFGSEEGDCVEFSNTLALLGRLAGIPSRVVTGYLAAEGLQTAAHLRGLSALRSRIPVLQKFPFDNLYMVTNLHSHSWTQFYIPDYGWLDFESTSFSIPPEGSGDFNTWDVVIPLFDEEKVFSQVKKFPWQAVLRAAGTLALFALFGAYALRYGRELVLFLGARRGGRKAARSLYLLLLARLAADGRPIKPASKTALEYAQLFPPHTENPHFKTFASLYTELRWREFNDSAERDEKFLLLKQEYNSIINLKQRGIRGFFIRLFSLRGLAYL